MSTTSERDNFSVGKVPFPVTTPFRMQPGLTRISEPLDALLRPDSPAALRSSQRAVERAVSLGRRALIASSSLDNKQWINLSQALAQMRSAWPDAMPDLFGGSVFNDDMAGAIGEARLAEQAQRLRAAMQDDFVLMTATEDQDLHASLLAVAMPSGWDPATKLGQGFLELHQPVADADIIRKAAPSLCAMMRAPGALRRYVWTIANSGDLSRHPDDVAGIEAASMNELWFRCERQTTYALMDGAVVLFVIRVYVERLVDVLAVEPGRAATLLAALNSMPASVIAYKSLQQIQPLVVRMLDDEGGSAFASAREQDQ